ncbi:MAG: hypothetical protein GF332_01730 [Candidatus Moranbacteria bacterium]|nr:hypothetical protein [Candidatus Moranbacteria bacterium]
MNKLLNLIPLVIINFVIFYLGYKSYKNKKNLTNILFFIFSLVLITWYSFNYLQTLFTDINLIKIFLRLDFFLAPLLSYFAFIFLLNFPVPIKKSLLTYIFFIIPALIMSSLSINGKIINNIYFLNEKLRFELGSYALLYYFLIIIYLLVGFISLLYKYRKEKGIKKLQIKYIFLGFFLSAVIIVIFNFFLQNHVSKEFFRLNGIGLLILILFIYYSIVRYRLFGIRFIFHKFHGIMLISIMIFIFFYCFIYLTKKFTGDLYTIESYVLSFLLILIFSSIILPAIKWIQKFGDWIFFKGLNPQKVNKDVALRLNKAVTLQEILFVIRDSFKKILHLEEIYIEIFDENKVIKKKICDSRKCFMVGKLKNGFKKELQKLINNENRILSKREIDVSFLPKPYKNKAIELLVPLFANKRTIGLMFLGGKRDKSSFNKEDIDFLEFIRLQISTAIHNALLYKKINNFNQELKKKVNIQTKELQEQNKRVKKQATELKKKNINLKKLLKMRGEFLNIASHQLRTPVTVIRGMADILSRKRSLSNQEKKLINGILAKSQKLTKIIHDILNASEMDTSKFNFKKSNVNLNKLLKNIYENKKNQISLKGLKFKLELPKRNIHIQTNPIYLEQAILNLVNNSIQYTKKGYIKIKLEEKDNKILIKIQDTGIGIPKKDIPRLFDKFIRAKNAVNAYTDGSGLGLFIAKKIIDAHFGASIYIESTELDKGTTITISFKK